jgi:hypothetical protein
MNRKLCRGGLIMPAVVFCLAAYLTADAKPNLSTPKQAATAFAVGLQHGDLAAIKEASVGSAEDYNLINTMARMVGAAGKLREAAVARFGPEEGKKIAASTVPNGDPSKEVAESEEKIEGDTATIIKPSASPDNALRLRKLGGQWKVDIGQFPQRQQLSKTIPMLDALQKVLVQATGDISSGKYATADEAQQAIQQTMFQVMAAEAKKIQSAPPQEKH